MSVLYNHVTSSSVDGDHYRPAHQARWQLLYPQSEHIQIHVYTAPTFLAELFTCTCLFSSLFSLFFFFSLSMYFVSFFPLRMRRSTATMSRNLTTLLSMRAGAGQVGVGGNYMDHMTSCDPVP